MDEHRLSTSAGLSTKHTHRQTDRYTSGTRRLKGSRIDNMINVLERHTNKQFSRKNVQLEVCLNGFNIRKSEKYKPKYGIVRC